MSMMVVGLYSETCTTVCRKDCKKRCVLCTHSEKKLVFYLSVCTTK